MSQRPGSPRLVVHLLIAVTVLGAGFGGGVLVGWVTRESRRPAMEKSVAPMSAAEAKKELAACRRELSARPKARVTPPAPATPPPGEKDAGLETSAKVEALQKEVEECRVRETLLNAYVCGTFGDHINLWFVFTHSTRCEEDAGLAEFLANSLKKCAEFDDFPAHLDKDELTREEESRVVESIWRRLAAVRAKNYVDLNVQEMRRRCRKRWALPDE
jgi:hypothetical protein